MKDLTKDIPEAACLMVIGDFTLGDNGENSKSAPIRLLARSAQPIEHWYWGRVVHDIGGMKTHKPRLPVDYCHDDKEIVGYLNKFDNAPEGLVASGALVPFKDSDRATEILHKSKAGVPYEASIFFGGDGIKIQEVAEGEVAPVNGYDFEGPGVIVREWPLRGVAICPYGADMNTESKMFSSNKKFSAAVISGPEHNKKEGEMEPVDSHAVADEEVKAEELTEETKVESTPEAVEASDKPEEAVEAEAEQAVEAEPAVESEKEPEAEAEEAVEEEKEQPAELSREEFCQIVDEFGAEIAAQVVRDGGNYASALKLAYAQAREQIAGLEKQCSEMKASRSGSPVPVEDANKSKKATLFNTGK